MGKYTGMRYCPSNSTAGDIFMKKFCEQCREEKFIHTGKDEDKKCEILNRAITYERDHPSFPLQWQYNLLDDPTCISFRKWDWKNGDPEEVNDVVEVAVNQITIEFKPVEQ